MAKVRGIIRIKGKIGDNVYYEMNGKNIVRKTYKGRSHMAKTAESHQKFRESGHLMKASNALSAAVYRMGKSTGIHLNSKAYNILNRKVKRRLHMDDINPTQLHYGILRRTMEGTRLDRVKTAFPISIRYINDYIHLSTGGNLEAPMLVNIFIGTLVCPIWKKDKYITQIDMQEVEVIQLRILPGESSGTFKIPLDLQNNQAIVATVNNKYCCVV